MKKTMSRRTGTLLLIAESVLNLFALPLSLVSVAFAAFLTALSPDTPLDVSLFGELETVYDPEIARGIMFLLFLVLAAVRIIHGFRLREKKPDGFFQLSLAQAGAFLVCGVLSAVMDYSLETTLIVSVLSGLALIVGRVFAIVKDHRFSHVFLNAIAILAIAYCALSFVMMGSLHFVLSVMALMGIIFSNISLPVLKKIILKTHAAEIIFGMILLIVTFSLLLVFFEPGIRNFKDALWYCFAIVTTIGFGDLTAVTDFGRVLSVILGAYGIVVVALITSIIVNFYGEMKGDPEADSSGEMKGDPEADSSGEGKEP